MIGLLSFKSEGIESFLGGDEPQNEIGFEAVLLLLAVREANGDFESIGDEGELSLIAFSFAWRLHL